MWWELSFECMRLLFRTNTVHWEMWLSAICRAGPRHRQFPRSPAYCVGAQNQNSAAKCNPSTSALSRLWRSPTPTSQQCSEHLPPYPPFTYSPGALPVLDLTWHPTWGPYLPSRWATYLGPYLTTHLGSLPTLQVSYLSGPYLPD